MTDPEFIRFMFTRRVPRDYLLAVIWWLDDATRVDANVLVMHVVMGLN